MVSPTSSSVSKSHLSVGTKVISTWTDGVRYKARITKLLGVGKKMSLYLEVMWAYRDGTDWPHDQSDRIVKMDNVVAVLTEKQYKDESLDLREFGPPLIKSTSAAVPKPAKMPQAPSHVRRLELVKDLEIWVHDVEKIVADYQKDIKAWRDRKEKACARDVERRRTKMKRKEQDIQQQIDGLTRSLRLSQAENDGAIRYQQNSTAKEIQKVMDDAEGWVAEQTILIADARKTIEDIQISTSIHSSKRNSSHHLLPPRELFCPITLELMRDPVMAMDGHTYEREAIQQHFETNTPFCSMTPKSPCTNKPLESRTLIPNVAIRSQCRQWQDCQQ